MGKYLAISLVMCVIAIANYIFAKENKDEPVKFWISMIISIVSGIVANIAFWKYIITLV